MIDVALGLIWLYLLLSVLASAVQEWIAVVLALRSRNLRAGIRTLLGADYAGRVYAHPLVINLAKGKRLPSYLSPETLSSVLLALLAKDAGGTAELRHMLATISPGHPLKDVLEALIDEGEDAALRLHHRLAGWFDEAMDRITGWYKRRATLLIFALAAALTVATNASTIHVAEELWRNAALRTAIAAQAAAASAADAAAVRSDALEQLGTLPIGWQAAPDGVTGWLETLLGWLMTIAAVSLGAPFWFDLLATIARLRGAGATTPPPRRTIGVGDPGIPSDTPSRTQAELELPPRQHSAHPSAFK